MNYPKGFVAAGLLFLFSLTAGLGLLHWQGFGPGAEGVDFKAFREKRLALPQRGEPSNPVALGDLVLPQGMGWSLTPGYRLSKERQLDLDRDGVIEDYSLRDGRLTVTRGSRVIWETPGEWWVEDFFTGDATNDGVPNLNLLVWKSGSFGKSKPFWVEKDDPSVKNHLFIFKPADGAFKPVWQSSNLDRPNLEAALVDEDQDGKNELLVIEGSYTDPGVRRITLWHWNGWGFTLVDQG